MSTATLLILLVGVFFITTRLARLARIWAELRRNHATARAEELMFMAHDRDAIPELGRPMRDEESSSSADLGVALALALRDAEADAQGMSHRLDAP